MLRSIIVAYLNTLNFLNRSLIFGSGNCFLFICALSLLKSVKIRTSPVFLACINVVIECHETLISCGNALKYADKRKIEIDHDKLGKCVYLISLYTLVERRTCEGQLSRCQG
jgi:hypothetical protein